MLYVSTLLVVSVGLNVFLFYQSRLYKRLTYHDSLTGIYNQRFFRNQLAHLRRLYVRHNAPFSLILLDIDSFKSLNDTYGHLVGDEALRKIATTLVDALRDEDYVCRIGGEEFMVMLPMIEEPQAALVAERLLVAVRNIRFVCPLTISGGVYQYKGESAQVTLNSIDSLLYQAKETGRNKIIV